MTEVVYLSPSERKRREEELRLRNNEYIKTHLRNRTFIPAAADHSSTWFPPRQIIKKDLKEMNRLYSKEK